MSVNIIVHKANLKTRVSGSEQDEQTLTERTNIWLILSRFGSFLTVGTVVKAHAQLGRLHVSVNLSLPVVDQGGRTDDQSTFRSHEGGI